MRLMLSVLLLLAISRQGHSASCFSKFSQTQFADCILLAPTYALHYTIAGGNVSFGVEVDGEPAWVGVGISEAGGMYGADIWVAEKASDGSWTVTDMFATGEQRPEEDEQQDVALTGPVTSDSTSTTLTFSRKLDTCDQWDNRLYTNLSAPVIWAYGPSKFSYHGTSNRGNGILNLPTGQSAVVELSAVEETTTVVLAMPNVSIPATETMYICKNFELPAGEKFHITSYQGIQNNSIVHHMIAYACSKKPVNHTDGEAFDCYTAPKDTYCQMTYLVWGPGTGVVSAPNVAGYPFGSNTSIEWFTLEVHYNNPDLKEGELDTSGFVLNYTAQLRKHDIGVLTLGSYDIAIPPGQETFELTPNLCPSSCTSRFTGPLTLIGSVYHMHGLGKSLVTQHIELGTELPPLGQRRYYDYYFEPVTPIPPESDLLIPGADLITTCTYTSTSRKNITEFGPATNDEMCFNFLQYYPKQEIETCISFGGLPQPLAVCASAADFVMLDPSNPKQGVLVPADLAALRYTPYNETMQCVLRNQANMTTPDAPPPADANLSPPLADPSQAPPPMNTSQAPPPSPNAAAPAALSVSPWLVLLPVIMGLAAGL